MKLKASRLQDRADIAALVNASLDIPAVRAYLHAHAPAFVPRFDALVTQAEAEQD